MKLIIAGGRDFHDKGLLFSKVDFYLSKTNLSNVEIVSGGAKGADKLGEEYAKERGLALKVFEADWSQGKSAGPKRNRQMAEYATHCICFWDGKSKGTKNMIDTAKELGLKTVVVNYKQ